MKFDKIAKTKISMSEYDFPTRAIHSGYDPANEHGALNPPIHMTSTFIGQSAEHVGAMFAGESEGHFYSRISNPTLDILETRMADLEGAESSLAAASGMGAISATLWSLIKSGDEIIVDMTLYGCTFAFMRHGLSKFGVKITHVDMTNPELLRGAMNDHTKIIYFETPANPNMRVIDIAVISDIAREKNAITIVDNTYGSPYLCRPIEHGADLVIHSATKYLSGHGDVVGGLASGRKEVIQNIQLYGLKDMTGAVMSPMTAMLLMRGIKTLPLRMDRHCESALLVAQWLEAHEKTSDIHYPGLGNSPFNKVAARQMSGFGGMIAFELNGGKAAALKFINALNLIHCAVSLGDAETLIQHPATMTHATYNDEERMKFGISDDLIRISIGLESVSDIIFDISQALEQL